MYVDLTAARCDGHRRLPRSRASQSRSSFPAGKGIEPEQFRFRYMQLTPDRHRGVENLMIEWFRPVWNKSGFGNKVTGVNRLTTEDEPLGHLAPWKARTR
jgi:hypothetical protein